MKETAIDHVWLEDFITITCAEQWSINKIKKYAVSHPDDVKIMHTNKDGTMVARLPFKWLKLSPPRKMSDEQREKASERFKSMWADKNNVKDV